MRPFLPLLLALTLAPGCVTPSLDSRGGFEAGRRFFSDSDWDELDEMPTVGVTATSSQPSWGADAGIFAARGAGQLRGRRTTVENYELYGGIRLGLNLAQDRVRLDGACGGTLGYFYGHDKYRSGSHYDHGLSLGMYARLGLDVRVGGPVWLGLGGRVVRASDAELFGNHLGGDYEQLTFTLFFGD